jgi:hypothetical protein
LGRRSGKVGKTAREKTEERLGRRLETGLNMPDRVLRLYRLMCGGGCASPITSRTFWGHAPNLGRSPIQEHSWIGRSETFLTSGGRAAVKIRAACQKLLFERERVREI